MQNHIRIALIKLGNLIKNPKIQFGTSSRELIIKALLADDDIKYVIDNYETIKVQFYDVIGKLENSQQNTEQCKWNIILFLIENLAQHRGDRSQKIPRMMNLVITKKMKMKIKMKTKLTSIIPKTKIPILMKIMVPMTPTAPMTPMASMMPMVLMMAVARIYSLGKRAGK